MVDKIIIKNEDDAWELLDKLVKRSPIAEHIDLIFKGWPRFELKFHGKDWQSSIPTRLMPPILDIQKDIYRAYAYLHYGERNARRLTDDEKAGLEIVLTVSNGSADIQAIAESIFNKLVEGAVTKMEAKHYITLLLGLGIVWGSTSSWNAWLDHQVEQKKIESQRFQSQEETRRMQLLAKVASGNGNLAEFIESDAENKNKLMRTLKRTDKLEIGGTIVDGTLAQEITHKPRELSKEIRLDGEFRIINVDSSDFDGFRIKVKQVSTGRELQVQIPSGHLTMKQEAILASAEWSKQPVYLAINAKELRGQITTATIINVKAIEEKS